MSTEIINEVIDNKSEDSVVFTCKLCGEEKPVEEITVITRFFPQMVACNDCRKKAETR